MTTPRIGVTDHAVRRYRERVKPHMTEDAAEAELRALVKVGEFTEDLEWVGRCNERWIAENPEEAANMAFVILSDGIAVALKPAGTGWTATTVLTRASRSPESAAARRKQKRDKRFKRRMARVHGRTQDHQFYKKAYGKHYAE